MERAKDIAAAGWRRFRGLGDRGASALEWAIIAAIVVVAATLIGTAIYRVVQNRATTIQQCENAGPGVQCGGGGAKT